MNIPDIYARMLSLAKNRQLETWSQALDMDSLFRTHAQILIENWYMYYGFHNLFLQRFEKEDDNKFAQRVMTATVENHIKFIINTTASYLYPKSGSLKRWVERNGSTDKTLTDLLRNTVWNHNDIAVDSGKALNALVTGYTIVQRMLYDVRTGLPMKSVDKTERAKYGYIKKRLLDSTKTLVLPYVDSEGTVYDDRLGAIIYITTNDNYIGVPDLMRLLGKTTESIQIMEYVDSNYWLKWTRSDRNKDWVPVDKFPGTEYQNKNPYGDITIPFGLYKNFGDPFQLVGNSEVSDLKSLNLEINELGNGDKQTIRYHSYPILVGLGGADVPNDFVRTANAVLTSEKSKDKAGYEYLTWEGKLEASGNRQDTNRRTMSNISGISLITRGFLKDIGQIRSGPPLKALFSSDRTSMNLRFNAFEGCESEDMRNDIRFYESVTGVSLDVSKDIVFKAEFDRDFLGLDELLDAQVKQLEKESGEDMFAILKETHPDWTDDKIEKAIEEFKKTQQSQKAKGPTMSDSSVKGSEQTKE